jgi:hypothetical protein
MAPAPARAAPVVIKQRAPHADMPMPPGVKLTVCPSSRDTRYSFDPPPGWRGAITEDWMAERARQQRHGGKR